MPREWLDLHQGVENHDVPQRFVVTRPDTGNRNRHWPIFGVSTKSGYAMLRAYTDGERIYYIDGNAAVEGIYIVAVNPETGSELWSVAPQTTRWSTSSGA
jgi:hypothetical protein